ncbi:[protein-PII] uridylyltransferase [Legionella londiniensis]|uniref:Bifunctional uridylyltransferase/uridylyl-removing enzyme n=1 Tax=Legionella londiniensis TaxID=45068 RepID=A0A0W0VNJ7_9GAMM|nr:[protein-PII] uridylyltransferase [Legionella londiniensis]KTD21624.1 protein-PII uridylyltransferase [Legionella londiniensis]STX93395.1 Cytosine/adenosine deaminase [Legionella londiniensis]
MKNDKQQLKEHIKKLKEELNHEFFKYKNITTLTQKLVTIIDQALLTLFQSRKIDKHQICLLALGSYGRRELQPYSDIDLLLLHDNTISETQLQQAQWFIQDCWDIGLNVSQQITTVEACAELASQDVSVISSILDMRLICGHRDFMEALAYQTHALHMWASHEYFLAKQQEQHQRYKKYGETAYNLEPNVKNGAGGLRDIQILFHIGKRHFGIKKLAEGIHYGFITAKEYEELIFCLHFLWRVRFALHLLAQKKEDRLLFDYQVKLASLFGYSDSRQSLAIEQFMKMYFKVIKRSRELNEMLLQWFRETIIHHQKQKIKPLDESFQLSNDYIEVKHPKVFAYRPQTLLTIFLWIAKYPAIKGVRANTIRLIREHLYLIDKHFLESTKIQAAFLAIFKTPYNPYEALQRMSRYGVLEYYLHCFSHATGQMQYDLFHVYTVDQHTLFVIRNLGRFLSPDYQNKFPLCCELMPTIAKREILYLAALFHDIGKGQGGDHSDIGAFEAKQFAMRHKLTASEQELLIWLVQNHLLMSLTAQRKDIYDPKTIQEFCKQFPHSHYLDYLYLLTVADICATNPGLWNDWKQSLLKELYHAAKKVFQEEITAIDEKALIEMRRQKALKILAKENLDKQAIFNLWSNLKNKYFLHESSEVIARHTKAILTCQEFPLILIMPHYSQGGTEVFIYMPHQDARFTITTTVLNNFHVTIQEATILTCDNQFDLDIYIILDEKNQAFLDEQKIAAIQQALFKTLSAKNTFPNISSRRLTRTQAHFKIKPQITFSNDPEYKYTRLFLVTGDKPGLLAHISRVFLKENIILHHAKIATAGERVEDTFYLSDAAGKLLDHNTQEYLRQKLLEKLTY